MSESGKITTHYIHLDNLKQLAGSTKVEAAVLEVETKDGGTLRVTADGDRLEITDADPSQEESE